MNDKPMKLCPICRKEPEVYKGDNSWYVWCGKCLFRSFDYDLESIARIMWNMAVDQTIQMLEKRDTKQ